jgi:hypothetical protein
MGIRDDIVANALWGCDNEPDIHYSQGGHRFDALFSPRDLPLYTDCSGFATLCYAWAGAPDPNGLGYNHSGFTGTMLNNLPEIPIEQAQIGDLIVYGPGTGDHVVVIVEVGQDPLCVSHGQERGPFRIRHSAEIASHNPPVRVLQGIGEEELADSDEILGRVNQAAMWAADADNKATQALEKATHIEGMLGSLITAMKEKGIISS